MSKKRKVIFSLFLAGALICGIGAGAAVNDISKYSYGDKILVGSEDLKTLTLKAKLPENSSDDISFYVWLREGISLGENLVIEEDNTLSETDVEADVTYDENSMFVNGLNVSQHNADGKNYIQVSVDSYCNYEDLKQFLDVYKLVLNDIKNHKINSYEYAKIEKCVLRLNPKTAKRLNMTMYI